MLWESNCLSWGNDIVSDIQGKQNKRSKNEIRNRDKQRYYFRNNGLTF